MYPAHIMVKGQCYQQYWKTNT